MNEVVKQILGADGCGIYHLIETSEALPSGLPGEYQMLTRIGHAKYATEADLEKDEVFELISEWPAFKSKITPGTVVSSAVAGAAKKILIDKPGWHRLSLVEVIRRELPPGANVEPEMAERLGGLVTPIFMSSLSDTSAEELRAHLKTLLFQGGDRGWHLARELLVAVEMTAESEDERGRFHFAPEKRRLSEKYSGDAVSFFRACREKLSATVEQMAEWVLDVSDKDRKLAVLSYILRGERGHRLAELLRTDNELRIRFQKSWLSSLDEEHLLIKTFNINEQGVILGRLGLITSTPPSPPGEDIPEDALTWIYEWWRANKAEYLIEYDEDVYPRGQLIKPSGDIDEPLTRAEWMKLLLLGAYHTLGWIKPRAYRNFLEDCELRGWFDVFIDTNQSAEDWIEVLGQYLERIENEDDPKYQYLFARQFVSIFQVSSNLKVYAEVLESINRQSVPFTLDQFTNPNKSEYFARSGLPMMPKMTKILGAGACFVIRDLVRTGVLTNVHAYPHCFAPVKQLRDIFSELGFNLAERTDSDGSRRIYEFIKRDLGEEHATFDMSFDIPFLMINKRWGSLQNFFSDMK